MSESIYDKVTNAIVASIESGETGKWSMPWHQTRAGIPQNVASKKQYRGINTLALWAQSEIKGYSSAEWGTYKQWQEKGAQVKKGEKASSVVFWKFGDKEVQSEGETVTSSYCIARGYSVFNAVQVDGYAIPVVSVDNKLERIEQAESYFAKVPAIVRHGGSRAYYSPMSDHVQMPEFQSFRDNLSYYGTLAHELTHWTSESSRCDRVLGKRFGDMAYAAEELIAELGAAFTMGMLGLTSEPRQDHSQYIASWLKVLKSDSRAIFTAASKAQQATDYLAKVAGLVTETEPESIAA